MAASLDASLADAIAKYKYYPEKLVLILWSWGSGPLRGIERPDVWQMAFLAVLGQLMRSRNFNGVDAARLIKTAVGSGRGPGKSALVGMIITILLVSWPDAKITVTANTDAQLDKRTWSEARKWMNMSAVAHWFEVNSSIIHFKGRRETWFAAPITWNEDKPQAFAGQQNQGSLNVMIFDEASTIPDTIFEVATSGQTTGLPIFMCFGNQTETSGFFYRAHDSERRDWDYYRSIDSRTCRFPNKEDIAAAIEKHGIDSDYVRVWVLGLPPKAAAAQYFDTKLINQSMSLRPAALPDDALVCGLDLSWGGEDPTKYRFRQGLNAWEIPPITIQAEHTKGPEGTKFLIDKTIEVLTTVYNGKRVQMLFMDSAGVAGPVAMRCRQYGHTNIIEVTYSAQSIDEKCLNVRSRNIRELKLGMQAGLGLDKDVQLAEEMQAIRIKKHLPLQFESKEELRKPLRLGRSTDNLDAIAQTYHMTVETPAAAAKRLQYQEDKPYRPASAYS